jgi:hypothetical protein
VDLQEHYRARFCEENVWHLCGVLPEASAQAYAVFISNAARQVAIWRQRSAESEDQPVVWDYHVVLLTRDDDNWQIFDADSRLAPPCAAREYLSASFILQPGAHAHFCPIFRLVPARQYRDTLCSDRSHMLNADGSWQSPPPPWPCIGEGSNLMRFIEMGESFIGQVHDIASLRRWLDSNP